jgi:hypothetical protein
MVRVVCEMSFDQFREGGLSDYLMKGDIGKCYYYLSRAYELYHLDFQMSIFRNSLFPNGTLSSVAEVAITSGGQGDLGKKAFCHLKIVISNYKRYQLLLAITDESQNKEKRK